MRPGNLGLHRRQGALGYLALREMTCDSRTLPISDFFGDENIHTKPRPPIETYKAPHTVRWATQAQNAHLLGVSQEYGLIRIIDTNKHPKVDASHPADLLRHMEAADEEFEIHKNTIFDFVWTRGDSCILTASADRSIVLTDLHHSNIIGRFEGHDRNVRCVSMDPSSNDSVFASGSRDGSICLFDVRSPASVASGGLSHRPIFQIKQAHAFSSIHATPPPGSSSSRKKDSVPSVTAVQFNHEGHYFWSGGADGCVKLWDSRRLSSSRHSTPRKSSSSSSSSASSSSSHVSTLSIPDQLTSHVLPFIGERRRGIVSLRLSASGSHLLALSQDNNIYMFPIQHPDIHFPILASSSHGPGPSASSSSSSPSSVSSFNHDLSSASQIRIFEGSLIRNFYIKCAMSHDERYIISGSSGKPGKIYLWDTNRPGLPIKIIDDSESGSMKEVNGVDFHSFDSSCFASCSDDYAVRIWDMDAILPSPRPAISHPLPPLLSRQPQLQPQLHPLSAFSHPIGSSFYPYAIDSSTLSLSASSPDATAQSAPSALSPFLLSSSGSLSSLPPSSSSSPITVPSSSPPSLLFNSSSPSSASASPMRYAPYSFPPVSSLSSPSAANSPLPPAISPSSSSSPSSHAQIRASTPSVPRTQTPITSFFSKSGQSTSSRRPSSSMAAASSPLPPSASPLPAASSPSASSSSSKPTAETHFEQRFSPSRSLNFSRIDNDRRKETAIGDESIHDRSFDDEESPNHQYQQHKGIKVEGIPSHFDFDDEEDDEELVQSQQYGDAEEENDEDVANLACTPVAELFFQLRETPTPRSFAATSPQTAAPSASSGTAPPSISPSLLFE